MYLYAINHLKKILLDNIIDIMAKGTKTGGRQKGTPNKVTKDLRLLLKDLVTNEIAKAEENLAMAEPKERLDFLLKLLPYILPRYESVSYTEEANNDSKKIFQQINNNLMERLDGSYRDKMD